MPKAAAVADRFLSLAKERGGVLTPMQLLKLVYIAHGWMLGLYGRPLIEEGVQAWQYGPVIPQLYRLVRRFRSNPVQGPLLQNGDRALDPLQDDLINQVYNMYGHMTGPALSRLTHAPGSPWDRTYRPGSFGIGISNDIIQDHYATLASSARD